jgi:hypothetical protein
MIKKTILLASILFLGYSLFIAKFGSKNRATLYVQQEYFAKSQDLLYNSNFTGKDVFVGSSLTMEAIVQSEIKGLENIGFTSLSSFDGLNLIKFKNQKPRSIYIETNYIQRDEKKKYAPFLFSPEQYYPKKIFASLREDSQPITIIGPYISKILVIPFIKLFISNKKSKIETSTTNNEVKSDDSGFSNTIANTLKDYTNNIPEISLIQERLNKLKSYVIDFNKKGINIVFVEIPINHLLINSPRSSIIRNEFYKAFPKENYNYINTPDSLYFNTTDGVHLSEEEAKIYTAYFKSKMLK